MMVREVFQKSGKLPARAMACPQRAGDVRSCQIDSCIDPMFLENTDISFKIAVDEYKFLNRDIEHIDIPNGMVVVIYEPGSGLHHIEHGNG